MVRDVWLTWNTVTQKKYSSGAISSHGALQPICIPTLTALAEETAKALSGSAASMLANTPDGQNLIHSSKSIKLRHANPDIPSVSSYGVSILTCLSQ